MEARGSPSIARRGRPEGACPHEPAPAAAVPGELALAPVGDADVDEDPEEEPLPPELLRSTKEWKGWRVSYCTLESDAGKAERHRRYLAKVSASVGDPLEAKLDRSLEDKANARLATKQLRARRSSLRSAFFRAKRS